MNPIAEFGKYPRKGCVVFQDEQREQVGFRRVFAKKAPRNTKKQEKPKALEPNSKGVLGERR